jgi:hypothetical protein
MRFAQSGRNTQNRFVLVFYDSRKTNLNVSDLEWAKRWHILLYPLPHPVKAENYYEMEANLSNLFPGTNFNGLYSKAMSTSSKT